MNKKLNYGFMFSTVIILLLGALLHSLYHFLNCNFVRLFAPVNESIWEHLKIMFYPTLLWWVVFGLIFKKNYELNINNWIFGATISSILSPLFVILFYYSAFYGFGIYENIVIHIIIQTLSIIISQSIGFHLYKYAKIKNNIIICFMIFIIIIMMLLFALFSFNSPNIPLFIEP